MVRCKNQDGNWRKKIEKRHLTKDKKIYHYISHLIIVENDFDQKVNNSYGLSNDQIIPEDDSIIFAINE